jgi:hypothetical protein
MRRLCKEIINMPPSLCEPLLACILMVIMQVFEGMLSNLILVGSVLLESL